MTRKKKNFSPYLLTRILGIIICILTMVGLSVLYVHAQGQSGRTTGSSALGNAVNNTSARTTLNNLTVGLSALELDQLLERRTASSQIADTEIERPKLVMPFLAKPLEFVKSIIVTDNGKKDGNIMLTINENDSGEIKIGQGKLSNNVILKENLTYLIQDVTIQNCAIGFIGVITPDGSTTCFPVDPDDVDSSFDSVFQKTATGICPLGQFLEAINQDGTLKCSTGSCNEDVIVSYILPNTFPHIKHPSTTIAGINECGATVQVSGELELSRASCAAGQVMRGTNASGTLVCQNIVSSRTNISCPLGQVMKGIDINGQPLCHDACVDCGVAPDISTVAVCNFTQDYNGVGLDSVNLNLGDLDSLPSGQKLYVSFQDFYESDDIIFNLSQAQIHQNDSTAGFAPNCGLTKLRHFERSKQSGNLIVTVTPIGSTTSRRKITTTCGTVTPNVPTGDACTCNTGFMYDVTSNTCVRAGTQAGTNQLINININPADLVCNNPAGCGGGSGSGSTPGSGNGNSGGGGGNSGGGSGIPIGGGNPGGGGGGGNPGAGGSDGGG